MANDYEMCGTIKQIMEPKTFASGFSKREFVLMTEDNFPQQVPFECVKQQAALLDRVAVNDRVCVHFRIRANPTKDGSRYFINLAAYQIDKMGADGSSVSLEADSAPPMDDEPMPF